MVKIEQVKHWAWRLVVVLLVALYLSLSLWNGICYHGGIGWECDLGGIYRPLYVRVR